ncbi:MAG: rRNA (guanine966-N2)-methyltransferase [Acetobacteraceae bacterium]|jgi:16S rRNA (guanine966-N2)-methyltransferase|nr:Methyltransferase [Rhodopila sp.]MEA2726907.1 rRNA (guanine966-N2)-methyltransferase [Acetobacteraceae bacterium]MEA2770856.1 rRNA (guanine966-N2)-methyltransferase [Acetobacteraceae bacterium]
MRIVAGAWRGRTLVAPSGQGTRPTADRVRQALFDMLMHAEWGGRAVIEGAIVLDVFAGTGALGLEALSRGAAMACFIESNGEALRALRANVAVCKAEDRTEILGVDVLSAFRTLSVGVGGHRGAPPTKNPRDDRASPSQLSRKRVGIGSLGEPRHGNRASDAVMAPASLVFLDPPYGQNLVHGALTRLREAGRIGHDALIVAELGREETWKPDQSLLAEREHGAARIVIFRIT